MIEAIFSLVEAVIYFLSADDIEPFLEWGYYVSPMMYGQTSILVDEFLDGRWDVVRPFMLRLFLPGHNANAYISHSIAAQWRPQH